MNDNIENIENTPKMRISYEVPSPLRVFSRHIWSNKDNKDNDD